MNAPLRLTDHPIQRTGAWAVAVLAERDHPDELTGADVDRVVALVVNDLRRAARAEPDTPAYDWWKVQNAQFPNAPPTHAMRGKWPDRDQRIAAMFDRGEQINGESCVFCEAPASARWAKDMLPLFDTAKARNTLPPVGRGWPVCWGCRVATWAVPYGAAVTAGSATLLTGGSDRLERQFVRRNVTYAKQIQTAGFGKTVRGTPERLVVSMLRHVTASEAVTLWVFKNDNQEPWLRVQETRRPIARFVRGLDDNPIALRGWATLCRALQRRDKAGKVTQPGPDLAARTLFEPSGRPRPVLLETIISQVGNRPDAYPPRDWQALSALARHYAKEMLTMDLAVVLPAAELLARWIAAAPNPRGRFTEYVSVATRPYRLGQLLMAAEARLLLDRRSDEPPLPMRADDARQVITTAGDGAQRRMLLFFAVVDALVARGVEVGTAASVVTEDIPIEEVLRSGDEDTEEEYA